MDGAELSLDCVVVDGVDVVRVVGELDVAAEATFAERLAAVTSGSGPVDIDLGGVAFIDSRGLNILVRAVDHLRAGGAAVQLVNVRPQGLKLLQLTGLDGHLLDRGAGSR